ncbi:hypothetical protein ACRRVB_02040 [Candidatus Cardinium hertigii]|uniref:hypothetical protein n=1 Tax=Candidatus Cardinium hertigii TaxID=247481 RepID=UPI003D7E7F46
MKRLLTKGLVCCATLVLTGRACKEAIPSKFKSTKKPIHTDRILNNHQIWQQNKVKGQGILKTIDITIEEACKMEVCLKEWLTKLGSLDRRENRVEPHSTSTMAKDDAYNDEMVQCASRSTILEKTEGKQIPNIRPTSERDSIKPIQFFTSDFKSNVANVHQHIPRIKELNMDKTLKTIQDRINMIIYTRKKDDDGQLRDKQKEKLRELKLIIKHAGQYDSFRNVIRFYSKINDNINKTNGEISKHDLESYFKEAKITNNILLASKVIEAINDLIDMMKIKKIKKIKNNQLVPSIMKIFK